jgi:hypothetical protein
MGENEQVDVWAESDLAWELAQIAGLHVPDCNRTDVFAAIGAGDSYAAIGTLLETTVHASVPVPPALLARIVNWLDAYAHHADAPRLHEMVNAIRSLGHRTDNSSARKTL